MSQPQDDAPRPSQAEGEPEPGAARGARADKAPRPSQAEGEAPEQQGEPGRQTGADKSGRSRVQRGEQFRAGQTSPAPEQGTDVPGMRPRPSQAEGPLDPGRPQETSGSAPPRPSQAEGELEDTEESLRERERGRK